MESEHLQGSVRKPVPNAIRVVGWGLFPGTTVIVGRLLYERFALVGPQMILFSFIHNHSWLAIWGLLSYLFAHLWFLLVVIGAAIGRRGWRLPTDVRILLILFGILLLTVVLVEAAFAT